MVVGEGQGQGRLVEEGGRLVVEEGGRLVEEAVGECHL